MITQTELNAIKNRAEKATPGPWVSRWSCVHSEHAESFDWSGRTNNVCILNDGGEYISNSNCESDAEFIAHAREDIPRLVAEIERLNEIIKNYNNTMRNLDALADSIIYETEYYGYSKMVAEKIIGLITELEKKVGDIV